MTSIKKTAWIRAIVLASIFGLAFLSYFLVVVPLIVDHERYQKHVLTLRRCRLVKREASREFQIADLPTKEHRINEFRFQLPLVYSPLRSSGSTRAYSVGDRGILFIHQESAEEFRTSINGWCGYETLISDTPHLEMAELTVRIPGYWEYRSRRDYFEKLETAYAFRFPNLNVSILARGDHQLIVQMPTAATSFSAYLCRPGNTLFFNMFGPLSHTDAAILVAALLKAE
jgi:hypothetical protein